MKDKHDRELSKLTPDQTLIATGDYRVIIAESGQIPYLLYEIGRLREITFRQVGEGTGNPLDLDRFDNHYLHMFLWNEKDRDLIGAYRLGLTDEIIRSEGVKGLYTRTLFQYGTAFLRHIGPAIELGRSFVRPEYQKSFQPLLLLWKGIARFVSRNPRYHTFFGPVSISRDYHRFSWHLMANYLKENNFRSDLATLIKAKKPLRRKRRGKREIQDTLTHLHGIRDLSTIISEIEKNDKGIPILLKHYLRLGAEILGFNVDQKFNGVLDALILLDLVHTDKKLLQKYMGKAETDAFLEYHEWNDAAECA
jgi:putative hemolysin